jgi:hypothetical protein
MNKFDEELEAFLKDLEHAYRSMAKKQHPRFKDKPPENEYIYRRSWSNGSEFQAIIKLK